MLSYSCHLKLSFRKREFEIFLFLFFFVGGERVFGGWLAGPFLMALSTVIKHA